MGWRFHTVARFLWNWNCLDKRYEVCPVRDSNDPATRKRKWQVPALVGMNVLVKAGNVLGSLEIVPSALQPAPREARLEHTSVRGVARVASQSFIPAPGLSPPSASQGCRSHCTIFWHYL